MDQIQWIFSGIGTQILSGIVGALVGGFLGYKIRDRQLVKQSQVGGKESEQEQKLHKGNNKDASTDEKRQFQSTIFQKQKAGDKSKQVQIGEIDGNNR